VQIARSSGGLAASPLRRSLESAAAVAPNVAPHVNPLFREVFLPTAFHSGMRLRPKVWTTLARCAWYCGWSPGVESLPEALDRASRATAVLLELAAAHQSVLLTGHGLLNGFIGMRLRRAGWSGPRFRPRRYWAFAVYRLVSQQLSLPPRIP
jgi:broad specificity phosphatase PhoE